MKKKTENPWKVLSTKKVYQSRFLKVFEDKVIDPQGNPSIHNLVSPGDYIGGVSVVALTHDNSIYLVRQYRYAYGGYTLELVGGGVEKGRLPLEVAKEELREEAGLLAGSWKKLLKIYPATEGGKNRVTLFLATNLTECSEGKISENNMSVVKIPLIEAVDLVMKGKIPLASSALGILMISRIFDSQRLFSRAPYELGTF